MKGLIAGSGTHAARALSLVLAALMTMSVMSCGNRNPVKIGYVAAITGRLSQLGIDARNGVEMAVAERNADGGVAGRAIELIVRDDEGRPEVGIEVLTELIDDVGVDAVIGPLTSNMLPAVEAVRGEGVLVFSPILSSGALAGKDDHFVRVNLTIARQAGILVEKMVRDGIGRTAIVFDVSNPQYTQEFATEFESSFRARGGEMTVIYPFDSSAGPDYVAIADEIVADEEAAVVFVAAGIDAGVLAQQLWKRDVEKPLYAAEWAKTSDLIAVGGRAVDGMIISGQYLPDRSTSEYADFSRRYQSRYGTEPDFAAQYAYESAVILLDAMQQAGTTELDALKRFITGSTHDGLVEPISIDAYGDAMRTPAFTWIENGRFIVEQLDTDD